MQRFTFSIAPRRRITIPTAFSCRRLHVSVAIRIRRGADRTILDGFGCIFPHYPKKMARPSKGGEH
jgi:hypothetical protein